MLLHVINISRETCASTKRILDYLLEYLILDYSYLSPSADHICEICLKCFINIQTDFYVINMIIRRWDIVIRAMRLGTHTSLLRYLQVLILRIGSKVPGIFYLTICMYR
jgi:hypothetical protein